MSGSGFWIIMGCAFKIIGLCGPLENIFHLILHSTTNQRKLTSHLHPHRRGRAIRERRVRRKDARHELGRLPRG